MKLAVFLCCLLALLLGAGSLLLRTSQAPFAALHVAPVVAPVPAAPVAPPPVPGNSGAEATEAAKRYTAEEFRALGEAALAKLPTKESLAALKEADAFVAPLPVLKAGEMLRQLAEAVHNDDALSPEAIVIYRTCAAKGEYPDSVRALCLNHYRRLTRKSGKPAPEGFAPGFIRELAARLAS